MDDPDTVLMSLMTLLGGPVRTSDRRIIGHPKDILVDVRPARLAYELISFGKNLEKSEKIMAIPWEDLKVDGEQKCTILELSQAHPKKRSRVSPRRWAELPLQRISPGNHPALRFETLVRRGNQF